MATQDDKIATLYKLSQGLSNTNTGADLKVESVVSRPAIAADRVFTQTIPITPPPVLEDLTWTYTSKPATAKRYISSTYPYIVKYENIPLRSRVENTNKLFDINAGGVNLLTNTLLPRVSEATPVANSYNIIVSGNYEITTTNYILDRDAGLITIFDGPVNGSSVIPTITFWRYEGKTLASSTVGTYSIQYI